MRLLAIFSLLALCGCASPYHKGFDAASTGQHDRAIELLKPYATTDSAVQFYFGWVNHAAPGDMQSNFEWAMAWYMQAVNQGHPTAANNIGVLYEYGQGVDADLEKAKAWYTLSARLGDPTARSNLTRLGMPVPAADLVPRQPDRVASEQEGDSWAELAGALLVLGAAANAPAAYPATGNESIRCTSYSSGPNTSTRCSPSPGVR